MNKQAFLPVLALLAVGLGGCGGGSDLLATVNGENITVQQYQKYLETKGSVRVRTANGQVGSAEVAEPLGFQALQDMIQQKLVLQMSKDEGVYPDDKALEKEVEFQKKRNPNFLKNLTAQGLTLSDIKERLRVDLARENVITKNITVKSEEAKKFIEENPKQFTEPAMADALMVFVKGDTTKPVTQVQKASMVDRELANGQEFRVVASRYTDIPDGRTNPVYPVRVLSQMPTEFRAAIEKTNVGRTTDWVKLSDGWVKFLVDGKTPEKKRAVDEILIEEVRRSMALDKGLKVRAIDKVLFSKYQDAKIDVKYAAHKESYKEFAKKLSESKNLEEASRKAGN